MLCWMSKIVDAVEARYRQHGTPRVAPPHRPENTSQGIASSGHTWMHVRGPQRSRMATEKREPLSAQKHGSAGLERFWSGTLGKLTQLFKRGRFAPPR